MDDGSLIFITNGGVFDAQGTMLYDILPGFGRSTKVGWINSNATRYIFAIQDTRTTEEINIIEVYSIERSIKNTPPTAVTLNTPAEITANSMLLSWSQNMDKDFANYTVYQSTTEGDIGNSIHVITDNATTSYNVTGLSPSTTYYFTVRVYDTGNLHNDSNQVSGKTLPGNQPPTAYINSILPNPATQGQSVTFTGHGTDADADGYIVAYNWSSSIVGFLSSQASFSISTLSVGTHTIYFKVQDNNGTWSSEVSEILTINPAGGDTAPPEITSVLAVPGIQDVYGYVNITCTVTDNGGVNIVKVNITNPNGGTANITMMKVGTNSYSYNASYSVLGTYSYYIWADDISGNQNKSAVYMFEIYASNLQPTAVVLNPPTDITTNSIQLSWSQNTDSDFSNYTIYQSASSGVLGDIIKVITSNATTSCTVTGLTPSTTYYFTVRVYDIGGLYNDSNQVNETTLAAGENHAPTPVISSPLNNNVFLTTDNIFFDGSNSSDLDNDDLTFYWASNISGYLGNQSKFYTTLPEGCHLITLYVNDSRANISTRVNITVNEPVINLPPTAVSLYEPTDITANSIQLSWSQNTDSDFSNYTVYQSTVSGVLGTAIKVITTNTTTSWAVTGLSPSTAYYFTVRVYDTAGLHNDSNQVSGTTLTEVTTGNLTGMVTDKKGKPIEGATVSIVATSHVTLTDSNGRYTFTGVPASAYGVTAEKGGYKTKTETGVNIKPGETTTLNIILEKEKKTEEKGFIPGFETVSIVILLGVIVLLRRKLL